MFAETATVEMRMISLVVIALLFAGVFGQQLDYNYTDDEYFYYYHYDYTTSISGNQTYDMMCCVIYSLLL